MGNSKNIANNAANLGTGGLYGLAKSAFKPGDEIQPKALDPLSPEARGLSNDLVGYARQFLTRSTDPNERFAGMGADEQSGLGALRGSLGGIMQGQGQSNQLLTDIFSGSRMSPDSNPYLSQVLGSLRGHSQDNLGSSMNMLDAAFGKSGMGRGSGRSDEAVRLAENNASNLNDTIANMLFGQYNQGAGEQMQALQAQPQIQGGNINSILAALSGLSLPRQLEQQKLDFGYNAEADNAMLISQILGGVPGMQFTTPQFAPSKGAQIMQSIGPLLQAAGAFAGA